MSIDLDYAGDVLAFAAASLRAGMRCVLGVVTSTTGGGVRAPGALIAVLENGEMAGYVSNGCVDADVAAQAVATLDTNEPRHLRYGDGSPFGDVVLPCGGSVEVWITPLAASQAITEASRALARRQAVTLLFAETGEVRTAGADGDASGEGFAAFTFVPRLQLRIVGRGAETLALARAALAARYDVVIWSPDEATCAAAHRLGAVRTVRLQTPSSLPEAEDDAWTAVVLLFHEHDWEPAILAQALGGPAPYVGALGSRRAQAARAEALAEMGLTREEIARIHGPIGLVPSLRDASAIAISILAEVLSETRKR
ncbi:XdhC family protein [Parvularcula dongshanensis]|uniref:Xanthine dehydrogenase accessory factor n=1 Tax=Parvularcula dongshanensis TaxID=1173995 RepID=A0A840I5F2_9PROT|nr:XdhC/CoxI family protein [Parvularcula dongshanensis]MBB4660079.1 xanthine dehydrogenase accessory factor [Parvularcula dongshanensis]